MLVGRKEHTHVGGARHLAGTGAPAGKGIVRHWWYAATGMRTRLGPKSAICVRLGPYY